MRCAGRDQPGELAGLDEPDTARSQRQLPHDLDGQVDPGDRQGLQPQVQRPRGQRQAQQIGQPVDHGETDRGDGVPARHRRDQAPGPRGVDPQPVGPPAPAGPGDALRRGGRRGGHRGGHGTAAPAPPPAPQQRGQHQDGDHGGDHRGHGGRPDLRPRGQRGGRPEQVQSGQPDEGHHPGQDHHGTGHRTGGAADPPLTEGETGGDHRTGGHQQRDRGTGVGDGPRRRRRQRHPEGAQQAALLAGEHLDREHLGRRGQREPSRIGPQQRRHHVAGVGQPVAQEHDCAHTDTDDADHPGHPPDAGGSRRGRLRRAAGERPGVVGDVGHRVGRHAVLLTAARHRVAGPSRLGGHAGRGSDGPPVTDVTVAVRQPPRHPWNHRWPYRRLGQDQVSRRGPRRGRADAGARHDAS